MPADYLEYLEMLREVFAECRRVLEPGGRIAVNVANLGRKPYRSLAADVVQILQDDLGLLLRGEVVWAKAEGASGSCAWGSFRSASNPVLRDLTERVVIASKGRFDRARTVEQRRVAGLPSQSWISNDEFMEATLDLWRIPSESATRVGHPAPFPVELPLRLIDLYTYRDDLVLDPFLGSGTRPWPPPAANGASPATTPTPATSTWPGPAWPMSWLLAPVQPSTQQKRSRTRPPPRAGRPSPSPTRCSRGPASR